MRELALPRIDALTAGLAAAALGCILAYMTLGIAGDWRFVIAFRAEKLASILLVAIAIAVSTVIFQTVTQNRILTPAIMGYDFLYMAIQTLLVFALGAKEVSQASPVLRFLFEAAIMCGFSLLLFRWLLGRHGHDIHLVVLAGVVCGVAFRSLASLLQRLLDPNEFSVLQDLLFANFSQTEIGLTGISAVLVAACCLFVWRNVHILDVLALGRDTAISLGVEHRAAVTRMLIVVALLVSVSTALVGPVTFFGLLVANLAYSAAGFRHARALPAAVLIGVIALVGGQAILEQVFSLDTVLSVIIEFTGGLMFIALLLRGNLR